MMDKPATITSAYAPDLEQVREWIEKMIRAMKFVELVIAIVSLITRIRDVNTELTKQLAQLRRRRPRSETLERLERQLTLPLEGLVPGAKQRPSKDASKPKKSRRGVHPGRAAFPAHLPRVIDINPVPPELRICPVCGCEMTTVGHSACEALEVESARVFVRKTLNETVACPNDDAIVSAPTPPQLVERGKLGTSFIVEATCNKYLDYQPIERQCTHWEREGIDIAPQTLGRGVATNIDLLVPIAKQIHIETRSPGLLSTDATGIAVLDRDAREGIRTGTVWCWRNARWVSFFYSAVGDSDSVRRFLGEDLCRTVQCDGTNITTFLERAGGKRPGCWGHGRRRLVEAARSGDSLALDGLRIIARLFVVERTSAREADSFEQRLARRIEHSKSVIDELRAWVDEQRKIIPPKTTLGKALGYLHRQWRRLILFLDDGRIELTNNEVERQLRKLVLGKKNWLFTWGDLGGERTATILTIVATCVTHGINPRAYLHLVTKLIVEGWPQSRLRELLPDRIGDQHPELCTGTPSPVFGAIGDLLRLPATQS
ncbi:MAG TPA: IS66 family transposase [Polyangiaceae bacterium]|jgi:transposase